MFAVSNAEYKLKNDSWNLTAFIYLVLGIVLFPAKMDGFSFDGWKWMDKDSK